MDPYASPPPASRSERRASWRWRIAAILSLALIGIAYAQAQHPAGGEPNALTLILAFGGGAVASFVGVLVGMGRYDERLKAHGERLGKLEGYGIEGMKQQLGTHETEIESLRNTRHEHANLITKLLVKLGMLNDGD